HRVIVHTGVVDQDLDRAGLEDLLERRARRGTIGDIEAHGFGAPAGGADLAHQSRCHLGAAVRVHVDVVTGGRETTAERRTDSAATAGDQRAFAVRTHVRDPGLTPKVASNTMLARPLSSSCGAPHTENSYSTVCPSPVMRSAAAMRSSSRSSRRATCSATLRTLAR